MELKEMLELAALAAGVEITRWHRDGYPVAVIPGRGLRGWEPSADDGDSRRLQVVLQIELGWDDYAAYAASRNGVRAHLEMFGTDPAAAARVAVLHVAAQMGAAMKEKGK